MQILDKILQIITGIVLFTINPLFPVKKGRWVLGSSQGNDYKEGSKYMFEYVNRSHSDIDAIWITRCKKINALIRNKGYKSYLNMSLPALYYTLTAEAVITSTSFGADLNYCFKKQGRKFVYLVHGMPQKKIVFDRPTEEKPKHEFRDKLYHKFVAAFKIEDINVLTSTSDFYKAFLQSAFRSDNVFNIGMPRNDALLNPTILKNEEWLSDLENKFVITYMPTHRSYGKGEASPFIFENNKDANDFFASNDIVLLIKNHPNMINKVILGKDTSNIIDISKRGFDAQKVIFHTDLLITDFSSVWIDYLLLRRPTLFYLYDNYERDDNETYFDIRSAGIGPICNTETELLTAIKETYFNYNASKPSEDLVSRHHLYVDANSSKRLYELIA